MNLKEFLKPNITKLVLFVILFTISTLIPHFYSEHIYREFGLPLTFYIIHAGCFAPAVVGASGTCPPNEFIAWKLIFDLAFWYLIAISIVTIYHKFKK